jgi:uncharacterized protein involved in exopolysaccharide biosynthesis
MELKRYLAVILKRKWIIIEAFLIITLTAMIGSFIQKPVYESSIKLLIEKRGSQSSLLHKLAAGDALTALSRTGSPLNTQIEIIKTNPILEKVIAKLGLKDAKGRPIKTKKLYGRIHVSTLKQADIILVSAQSLRPEEAANIANAIGEVFVAESQKSNQREAEMARKFIEKQLEAVRQELLSVEMGPGKGVNLSQKKRMAIVAEKTYLMLLEKLEEARIAEAVKVGYARIIEPATVPKVPLKPRKALNTLFGAFFGILFGTSIAFLFEYLDDSIKTAEEVRSLIGLPVLGIIPHFEEEEASRHHKSNKRWWERSYAEWKYMLIQRWNNINTYIRKDRQK